ncbi:DUF1868 domain-containing protein [Hoeflea alexandrii]|uniref:DUF1868 domain-containing protein n=1 Tax=Hoeflea alexandrii TaxID=288436 RepID=UPI0031C0AD66|nr:DUF1868 domain-containing protein [Hoeflea sp.]
MLDTRQGFLRQYCGENQAHAPFGLGVRFDQTGIFLREPGNTVVCHVVPGSATQRAMTKIRDRLESLDQNGHFTWTPVSSYHMTVFNGVIDSRREPDHWPADMPLDAGISETTDYLIPRLAGIPPVQPLKVKLDRVTPLGLVVSGATTEDEAVIRDFRDRLTAPFGYRKPDHAGYVLHLTIAYLVRWLPRDVCVIYLQALQEMTAAFQAEVPILDLGPADFCTFDDMNHFEPVLGLS